MLSESEFDEKTGAIFTEWRKNAKLTQDEVAKKLGIARRTYINIESGITHTKFYTIFRMAEITSHAEESIIAEIKGVKSMHDDINILKEIYKKMLVFSSDMTGAARQVFFGKHGSDLRALLHFFALYTQLPMRDRQGVTSLALSLFKVSKAHGDLSEPEGFMPDIELIEKAQQLGQQAAIKKENGYKIR